MREEKKKGWIRGTETNELDKNMGSNLIKKYRNRVKTIMIYKPPIWGGKKGGRIKQKGNSV